MTVDDIRKTVIGSDAADAFLLRVADELIERFRFVCHTALARGFTPVAASEQAIAAIARRAHANADGFAQLAETLSGDGSSLAEWRNAINREKQMRVIGRDLLNLLHPTRPH